MRDKNIWEHTYSEHNILRFNVLTIINARTDIIHNILPELLNKPLLLCSVSAFARLSMFYVE